MTKTRVYEVARDLGLNNRDLMGRLASLGIQVRNHMSVLDTAEVERAKRAIEKDKQQNVVEERIRPTVVRRRVKRGAVPAEVPVEAKAEATEADASEQPAAAPRRRKAATEAKPEAATAADEPSSPPAAPEAAPEAAAPEPEPTQPAAAAAPEPATPAAEPAVAAAVAAPPATEEVDADGAPRAAMSYEDRLGSANLPPGVVARGSQQGAKAAPLSEAARNRIVTQHAAKAAAQPPRRRELVRSAIGPTGRQQQRSRPGRARKLAPGKKAMKTEITVPSAAKRVIRIEGEIGLQALAGKMSLKATDVLGKLMQLGMTGVMINSTLDYETASILAGDFGFEVENVAVSDDDMISDARGEFADVDEAQSVRAPVVTVMGHVDHGKTSLLDRIRKADVAAGEAGGITQHLGAYRVDTDKGTIVFIDTPGHAAFTAMRARGATATDLVILVVAADDGVMPQTKEAVAHAREAKVPVIVAVNKCDKEGAQPEVIKRELANDGLQPEDWGGETIYCEVSAKTGDGIDKLLDSVLLQSEVLELRANPDIPAQGIVLESYLDKGRGPVANVLIQNGTLKAGVLAVAGGAQGKVRALTDDRGKPTAVAGPATPVEVLGLSEVPNAGDAFHVVKDAKAAQALAERRKKGTAKAGPAGGKASLEALVESMKETDVEELKLVVKADVQGSCGAVVSALTDLSTSKVRVNVIHQAVGGITENDVMLASASNAIVIGFHVRAAGGAIKAAKAEQVQIKTYSIIYEAIDDVRDAMVGLLKPEEKEVEVGRAEVRQLFSIPKGVIAGCFVADGKIVRSARARVMREEEKLWEGGIKSLRRIKDDVREVAAGLECGVGLEGFNDLQENDIIECFDIEEVSAVL